MATAALRSALAAIDNAGAVAPSEVAPPSPGPGSSGPASQQGPIAGSVVGLGAAEVPRRSLDDHAIAAILQREIDERIDAAAAYRAGGRPDAAERLEAEAAVLAAHLAAHPAAGAGA